LRAVRSLVRHGGTRVRDAKAALLAMDYPIRTVMPAKAGAKRVGEGSERGGDMPEYAPAPPRAGGGGGSALSASSKQEPSAGQRIVPNGQSGKTQFLYGPHRILDRPINRHPVPANHIHERLT
jgi:hypothetical protein